MEKGRNFANIGFSTGVAEQNMHHFMSNSPWSAWAVIQQVQVEISGLCQRVGVDVGGRGVVFARRLVYTRDGGVTGKTRHSC